MRDGSFTLFLVQHRWEKQGEWTDSNLSEILFGGLSYQEKQGERGDSYRALIRPENMGWRATGTHGFLTRQDAWRVYDACVETRPEHDFRVVRRTWAQVTVPEERPLPRLVEWHGLGERPRV